MDCADTGQTCDAGACVGEVNLCGGVTCDAPADPTCDGTVIKSQEAAGTCAPATGECSYADAADVDCADTGQTCDAGACVGDIDLCIGVTCDAPPAATCDGDVVKSFTADAGTCDAATGECSYTAADDVDCTDTSKICLDGACVDPTPTPTYTDDVKPILEAACNSCHTAGSSGGTSFGSSYEDTQKNSYYCDGKTVGECTIVRIQDGSMQPPNKPQADEVSAEDQAIIQAWIDGGMPE